LDEKAASFTRKLMRQVPMVDDKGNNIGGNSYSQVVATFLHNPTDTANNKELKRLE
jgi:hypothetical protein